MSSVQGEPSLVSDPAELILLPGALSSGASQRVCPDSLPPAWALLLSQLQEAFFCLGPLNVGDRWESHLDALLTPQTFLTGSLPQYLKVLTSNSLFPEKTSPKLWTTLPPATAHFHEDVLQAPQTSAHPSQSPSLPPEYVLFVFPVSKDGFTFHPSTQARNLRSG